MALQLSGTLRDAMLDAIESVVGPSPIMTLRTGAPPANCAAANTGTGLATLILPSDWLAAASGGTKVKSGTWQDTSADASGTAGHWRIHDSGGTICHLQGTVTQTGGGGDLTLDNVVLAQNQSLTINTFSIALGNA
jgi:hypothetical protein